jgi:hypothetical protein
MKVGLEQGSTQVVFDLLGNLRSELVSGGSAGLATARRRLTASGQ